MRVGCGVDQLRVHPDLVAQAAYASFEDIPHRKFAADLLHIDPLAPIGEGSAAGDYEHACNSREIGRQILGDCVREILLFPVVAEVRKREDDDR